MSAFCTKTIVFIRHAEATHNAADRVAQAQAVESGGCTDAARLRVLDDAQFLDAPLSAAGERQASAAGRSLRAELLRRSLTPTLVWHSPLRRAAETARLVFDGAARRPRLIAQSILRERVTWRPCDMTAAEMEAGGRAARAAGLVEEDNAAVRQRAVRLLAMLAESFADKVIAIVSHKRFLIELGAALAALGYCVHGDAGAAAGSSSGDPPSVARKGSSADTEGGLGRLFFSNAECRIVRLRLPTSGA